MIEWKVVPLAGWLPVAVQFFAIHQAVLLHGQCRPRFSTSAAFFLPSRSTYVRISNA